MLTSKTQRVNTQNAENLSGTKAAAKFRSKADLGLDALEPRILLDAAAVASGAEMAMDVLSQTDSQAAVDAIFNPQIDMQKEPAEQDISPEMLAQLDRIEEAFEPVLESNAALSPVKESGGFKPANVAEYGGFKPASITEAADETQQGETTAGSVDAVTDDGNYEIHSGETINVDLFANDFIKGELVGIIDPADPNTIITLTENETVELSSGLRAAFLEDGTFDVTGPSNPTERTVSFDYVIQDGSGETHRATATFDWPVTPTIDLDVNNIPPIPGQNGFAVLDFSNLDESSGSTDIGNDGQTEEADGVGNGEFAIYRNVGTIDGQRIDVIATVVRFIGDPNEYPGATPQDGDNPDIGNNGNDGMVILGNADTGSNNDGTFEIRYDVVLSGTDIPVTGNFAIAISDLDATDGTEFGEEVAVNTANLDSFIIGEGGTSDTSASGFGSDIIVENIATQEIFRANQDPAEFITEGFIRFTPFDRNANNAFGSPQANSVQLNFTNTSTFTLIFHRDDQPGGFNLNGGFTSAFFDNPVLVDTNDEFANVFVEGDDPIAIAANTIEIFDEFSISGASIEITNAQLDDVIAVTGTLPAGITATVNSPTSITLMGAATPDAYEQAILAITFENTSSEPNDTVIREIDITVSDDEALTSNTATSFIQVIDIPNDPPVAVDDGPISATGNVIENIDVISNDTDPDPDDSLAVTGIIDPADPGVIISISAGQTVTLASGTTVTLLVNGTLDVLTTPLGLGDETFEYVVSDGLKTDTGEVTLDRSQGSLVSVPASVSGLEDTAIDLGITIDPAIIAGGALPDIIGTDAGFRDGADGATPINFTIPANTTSIRITAYGGLDNGNRSGSEEELQTVTLTVDLAAGTFSGHIFHSRGQSQASVDNYTFNNIALGSASDSNLATPASFSAITLDVVDGVLSLIDSELLLDQAYLVEFLSADGTSVDLLGSSGSVQTPGVTVSTLDIPVEANLVILAVQSGRDGDSRQEDNSNGRIVIDLDTGLASGTLSAQVGRGVDFNTAFAFTDYDITSGESIFTNATIVGDIEGQGNVLVDYTLSLNGDGDLVFERPVDVAQTFSTLISAQSFDRLNEGSAAVDLGSSSTRVNYVANSNVLTTFALDIPEGAQTANLTLATANTSVGNIGDNENRGTATIFVDLVNGTTSGTFIGTRSDSPDLVQWTEVPFGTPPFDSTGPTDGVTSNHSAINHFTDQLAAVLTFDLITAADGSQTLQGSAQPTASQQLGDFANYTIVTQAQYSGRTPVTISGYTTGGTFSSGAFNPETGNWEVDAAELVGLSFIPAEHFSGETEAIVIDYNGNGQTILVDIVRVADAPSLTTVNQIGNENTVIAISDAVASSLVDQDSSETLLIELSGIPEGHSVSDGTNSFTASAGSQSVDVTGWGLTALTYEAPIDVSGDFIIDVRAQSTDTDGFTPTEDTAETTDAFTVTILADTDGDGVADTDDVDDDNDGILDVVEQPIDRQQIITSAGTNTTEVLGTFTSNGTAITTTTNATQGASIGASSSFIADSFSFNEQGFTGTVTTEFSSPVSDIVIDFASVINTSVIGNFTVELANGVILSNLDFTVDPTLPSSFGNTRDLLTASTNGDDIITAIDADGGGGGDQAGGTLRFADLDLDQVLAAGGIVSYAFDIVEASGSAATAFFNISASALVDTDNDGIANHLDIDSDDDGITDNIEAQTTDGYIAPSGVEGGITDINQDGLDDNYDTRNGNLTTTSDAATTTQAVIDLVDTDGLSGADYIDPDSDDDGILDVNESGLGVDYAAGDTDGDGLADVYEQTIDGKVNDGYVVNEDILPLDGTLSDSDGDAVAGSIVPRTADLDYRDIFDTDGDGVADNHDVDDDNDGILDTVESEGSLPDISDFSDYTNFRFELSDDASVATWTNNVNDDATTDGALTLSVSGLLSLPTVIVNGVEYTQLNYDIRPELAANTSNVNFRVELGGTRIHQINLPAGSSNVPAASNITFAGALLAAGSATDLVNTEFSTIRLLIPTELLVDTMALSFEVINNSGSSAPRNNFSIANPEFVLDSDQDGIYDHLDIDSDNDGITDNIEAQSTAGYIAPSGVEAGITDINNDGLDDAYDSRTVDATTAAATEAAGEGIDPVNTDAAATTGSDTTPDYRDTDSDGDGRNDTLEADLGTTPAAGLSDATTDADGDGLFDVFETQLTGVINDGFNVNEDIASLDGTFPDAGGDTSVGTATPLVNDLDFRDLNDAPTAVNDGPIAVTGGAPQDISVFAGTGQDSDPDGDVISITAIFDPAAPTTPILLSIGDSQTLNSGTIVQLLAGNVFRVTTQVVLTGADSFDYVISDASGETDRASVTLSSVSGNTNPNAQNDAVDAAENTVLNFSAFANNGSGIDSDGEGDNFAVTRVISGGSAAGLTSLADGTGVSSTVMPVIAPSVIAGSNGGAFTVTDLGQINFDPNDDFDDLAVGETRTTQIAYQIDDGNGGTDTAVVTVTVQGENDAPSAVGTLAAQMGFDGTAQASFNASTIFSDVDGDTLSFSSPNLPSWMNLDSGTGIITGQPPANASQGGVNGDGVYTVTVVASDGDMSVSSSVTYTFANLVPTAEDDALSSFENTSSNFDAFAENPNLNLADSDPDGDSFTVTRAATGNDVSALAALADGTGVSTANVGAAIAGSMGGLFALQSGGEATFDPNGEFDDLAVGETRVTEIVYQIDDGEGGTDTAVISYTVIGENDAPIPQIPGSPTPPVDAQNYIPAQTGVDNAAPAPFDLTPYFDDPDSSDVLTLSLDPNDLPPGLVFDGAVISGTLDDDASQGGASGVYVIPVTVSDGNGGSFTTTVTYTIANPAPIAVDDVNLASEDSGVSANVITGGVLSAGADSDPDGDELSVTMVGGAAANIGQAAAGSNGGLFTIGANGSYTFSSNGEFESLGFGETALTSITYQISDGNGGFDTATLEVTVEGQNDGPIPVIPGTNTPPADDQNYIPAVAGVDSVPLIPLDISVYFDDVDGDPLSYSSLDLPSWMRLDPDTGIITGTPPANGSQDGPSANGIYTVTISAEDAQGESFTTQMDYVIGNPSPIAVDDSYITPEDTPISGNLMANDSDPDGDSLRLDVVSLADGSVLPLGGSAALAEGQLTVNADGIFDFVPAPDFNGTLSFGYVVSDGQGGTDVGAVVIIVTPVDEPPMVIIPEPPEPETPEPEMPEPETPEPETPYNGMPPTGSVPPRLNFDGEDISPVDVSTGFSDPEGEALSFSAQGLPPGLTLDPTTGIITGTLPGGASGSGPYTVIITAIDPDGLSVSAEFVWTVENVVPIASPLPPVRALDSTSVSIPAAEAFVDPDGDALRYSAQGVPEGLSIDPQTGMITGMLGHSASQQGPYFITVIATDAQGATTQTIIELIVNNPPPVIEPIELPSMVPGEEIVINVGEMTTDPDGDVSITFTSPDLPLGLTIDIKTGIISGIALAATAAQEFTVFANDSEGGITPVTLIFNVSEDPYIDDVEIFEYSIHGKDDGSALLDGYGASSRESHLARWFDGRRDDDARALGGENVASFLGGTAAGVDLPEYGAQARIWVEGVASSHLVTLQLMETISSASSSDASDSHVRAWNVSLVSGAALPEGVFYEAGADVVTLNRTAVQGAIALRVQAMLSDGRAVSLVIDVDVQNVLIERRGEAAVQAQTLDQQLKIAADDIGGANAALTKALKTNM